MNVLTDPASRLVIAHRGNAAHAPENTLESFAQAVSLGADALEFDVRLTSDGVPVVIHDPTLTRTTDRPGTIAELPLSAIREANAGANFTRDRGATFPYRARALTIPTAAEVIDMFPGIPLLIEVKVAEASEPLLHLLDKAGASNRVVLGSMSHEALQPFRRRQLPTGASGGEVARLIPRMLFARARSRLPYQALCIPRTYYGVPIPAVALARRTRSMGVVTHIWTIDSPSVAADLWRSGVQGVVTNDPATMIELRRRLPESQQ
jgi:glycerophosphoryl diester phosphodiesterase